MSTPARAGTPTGSDGRGGGAWSPFKHRVFAVMWTASLIGNVGTWMRDVGAGWLMTSLSPSATMVALVQAAGTLPIFLLALPAGALADLVDRRRLLMLVNVLLLAVAVALGVVAQLDAMTAPLLLSLLLVGGIGTAVMAPVLQSLTPLQVPRHELRAAIALNSVGVNVARAIGPAAGGLIAASTSVWVVFYLDAMSYVFVIAALLWWRGAAKPASDSAPEAFGAALRTGLRFAWHTPEFKRTLLRAAAFFVFASAYWALLPLLVRKELAGDANDYGWALACVGVGAVAGGFALPRWRARFGAETTLVAGTALTAAVLIMLSLSDGITTAYPAFVLAGVAWIAVLTTANTAAQTVLPNWVRGRGLAIYLTAFYGAMTAGSVLWGQVADVAGVRIALAAAAFVGVASLVLQRLAPLADAERDLTPSLHWPEPPLRLDADEERAVMVSIDYRVDPVDRPRFVAEMHALATERRRNGATFWQLWESSQEPGHYRETFVEPSWQEHMRHHARVTVADADVQERLRSLVVAGDTPRVEHWLAAPLPDRKPS